MKNLMMLGLMKGILFRSYPIGRTEHIASALLRIYPKVLTFIKATWVDTLYLFAYPYFRHLVYTKVLKSSDLIGQTPASNPLAN